MNGSTIWFIKEKKIIKFLIKLVDTGNDKIYNNTQIKISQTNL